MNQDPLNQARTDLAAFRESVDQIKTAIGRFIIGQEEMVELMIAAMISDGHILIEGVPGVAKTMTAKLMARCVDGKFSRIQFTPDLMPSDVMGTSIFNTRTSEFEFRPGPVFGQIVLIDEINRAPAKTQAALFEVMEERQLTIDGISHPMDKPFIVVATQNPIEQEGTYRLPEAQLDRFLFKITVGYPSAEEEERILTEFHERKGVNDLNSIQPFISTARMGELQALVRGLHIEPQLISYIVSVVNQTRIGQDLFLGASPRASLNIMTASKAMAALRGRDFVTPEDVKFVALPVLRHRVILTPEREMEGVSPDDIIGQLLEKVEVPR